MGKPDLEKILITGASGMVGRAIQWGQRYSRSELDVCNPKQIEEVFSKANPSAIIHLAGLDINQAEADPKRANDTNVLGTKHIALAAKKRKIPIVFLSSACIFNGPIGSQFSESDTPAPCNIYGHAKLQSEMFLKDIYPEGSIIVRTSWVFGGHGSHHKKFVDIAIEAAKRGNAIFANRAQEGSPTYVVDLIQAIQKILLSDGRGVFHIANKGRATAWDIAKKIVEILGSKSEIKPLQKSNAETQNHKRSASEVLTSNQIALRSWEEALREYVLK